MQSSSYWDLRSLGRSLGLGGCSFSLFPVFHSLRIHVFLILSLLHEVSPTTSTSSSKKRSSAKKSFLFMAFKGTNGTIINTTATFVAPGCLLQDYEVFQIMENYISRSIGFCHPLGIPVPVIHHHLDTKIAHVSTSV